MYKERLNRTEIEMLETISAEPCTITELARAMKKSKSYISESVKHLCQIGFAEVNNRAVQIAFTPLGNEISRLIREESIINRYSLLNGSRLKVLPLVMSPGYSAHDISRRTGLSPRTVQAILGKWRQMGIVILKNHNYTLNPRHESIISLTEKYIEHRNLSHLKACQPDGMLLWQGRGEYIFSLEHEVAESIYTPAASTRLIELGYDLISRNAYYHYSPISTEISRAEALVQSLKLDPLNPRIKRLIRRSIKDETVTRDELEIYFNKYAVRMQGKHYDD